MSNIEIAGLDPKVLWQSSSVCPRSPVWAFVDYRTPEGVKGILVYDSSDDRLWFDITSGFTGGNGQCPPWFARHMSALLPEGTVLIIHDKFRRWNTADFVVGVDERLRWRY